MVALWPASYGRWLCGSWGRSVSHPESSGGLLMPTGSKGTRMDSPATKFAYAFGAVYLLVGLVGFFLTGFDDFFASQQGTNNLLWFEINPAHNVVHLLVGGAWLAAGAAGERISREVTMVIAVTYAVVGVVGFFATGQDWNILALNTADNWLHIGTALAAFAAASASSASSKRVEQRSTHVRA